MLELALYDFDLLLNEIIYQRIFENDYTSYFHSIYFPSNIAKGSESTACRVWTAFVCLNSDFIDHDYVYYATYTINTIV